MDFESSWSKTKVLIATLTEFLAVAFRETEFEYQDESDKNSVSGQFDPSNFHSRDLNALFDYQVT